MPGGDGTGPMGRGPMTGRGLGPCGRGLGRGSGFGRGFGRRWAFAPAAPMYPAMQPTMQPTKEQELQMLEDEQNAIKEELEAVQKRITQLKGQK